MNIGSALGCILGVLIGEMLISLYRRLRHHRDPSPPNIDPSDVQHGCGLGLRYIVASKEVAAELERLQKSLYANQPDTFDTLNDLISLLEVIYCEHDWDVQPAGADPASAPESVVVCKRCGFEKRD